MNNGPVSRFVARRAKIFALWVNKRLSRYGFRIARVEIHRVANAYIAALCALESTLRRPLKIVVVGANDGKWNDPLYTFLTIASQKPRVLFCEPQVEIVERLAENVSALCDSTIEACAISSNDGHFSLFRVRPSFWGAMAPAYMTDAPAYRAPSGIASADRRRVEAFVRKSSNVRPEVAIEEIQVTSFSPKSLLEKNSEFMELDVLQVDVEGQDDIVVMTSLATVQPRVVLFESSGLSPQKLEALGDLAQSLGYRAFGMGRDTLLISSGTADIPEFSPIVR